MNNLLQPPAHPPTEEIFEKIISCGEVRIERIVSFGHKSPDDFWYDQHENEWVVVLEGDATIEFDDGEKTRLLRGEHCFITARKKHRVISTCENSATIWLAVFFPPGNNTVDTESNPVHTESNPVETKST